MEKRTLIEHLGYFRYAFRYCSRNVVGWSIFRPVSGIQSNASCLLNIPRPYDVRATKRHGIFQRLLLVIISFIVGRPFFFFVRAWALAGNTTDEIRDELQWRSGGRRNTRVIRINYDAFVGGEKGARAGCWERCLLVAHA